MPMRTQLSASTPICSGIATKPQRKRWIPRWAWKNRLGYQSGTNRAKIRAFEAYSIRPKRAGEGEIVSIKQRVGGDGGIRTLDRALQPYNGLANRRLQPLGHISGRNAHA